MSGPPDIKLDVQNFITSMLPDGTVLQFPKGTPPEVVDRVFQQKLGEYQTAKSQPKQLNATEQMIVDSSLGGRPQQQVGGGKAFGIGTTQGLTFNLGDEIASSIAATVGYPPGRPGYPAGSNWGERYDSALNEARGVQNAAKEQHPYAYGAGEVTGAVVPALVAPEAYGSSAIVSAPTMLSAAGRAAAFGGAQGALYGFGGGEGGAQNRLHDAAIGGATGAVTGAVTAPISRAVGNLIGRAPNPTIPTTEQLRTAGNAAYDMADNAGVIITPDTMRGLLHDVQGDLATFGFHPANESRIVAPLQAITEQVNSGMPITLRGLDTLRKIALRAGASPDDGTRELSRQIVGRIDDLIDGLGPKNLVTGDADVAVPAIQTARQVWSTMRKSQFIDELVDNADIRNAVTNSGGNLQNKIRQRLADIITRKGWDRGFSQEERDAIEQVARGTTTQNALRILGRLAPSSNAWLGVLSTMGAGPAGLAVPAVGAVAKSLANSSTRNAVQDLSELIRSGAGVRIPAPAVSGPSLSDALLAGTRAGTNQTAQMYAQQLLRQQQ